MEAIGRPPRRRPARPPVATRTGGEAERLLREVDQAPGRKLVMADFVALPDLLHDASFGPGVRAALIEAVEEYRGECVLCRRPWTPPDDGGRPERLPAAAVTVKVVRPPAVGEPRGMRYGFVCRDCREPPDQARAALERMLRTDFIDPDAKELPLLTEAGSA